MKYKILEGLTISCTEFCLRQMKTEHKHFIYNCESIVAEPKATFPCFPE